MRYREIIETAFGQKVWTATQQRHDAMRSYQDTIRTIQQTTPKPQIGQKEAKAREKLQAATTKAADSIKSAAMKPRPPVAPS